MAVPGCKKNRKYDVQDTLEIFMIVDDKSALEWRPPADLPVQPPPQELPSEQPPEELPSLPPEQEPPVPEEIPQTTEQYN